MLNIRISKDKQLVSRSTNEDFFLLNIGFLDESILMPTHQTWVMFFDGSFKKHGSEVGILFITPHKDLLPNSYNFFSLYK